VTVQNADYVPIEGQSLGGTMDRSLATFFYALLFVLMVAPWIFLLSFRFFTSNVRFLGQEASFKDRAPTLTRFWTILYYCTSLGNVLLFTLTTYTYDSWQANCNVGDRADYLVCMDKRGEIGRGALDGRSVVTTVYHTLHSTITNNLLRVASLLAPLLASLITDANVTRYLLPKLKSIPHFLVYMYTVQYIYLPEETFISLQKFLNIFTLQFISIIAIWWGMDAYFEVPEQGSKLIATIITVFGVR